MRACHYRTALYSSISALALALITSSGLRAEETAAPEGSEAAQDLAASEDLRTLSGSYLAGRIARAENDTTSAARYYRDALGHDPDNEVLLEQAFQMEVLDGTGPTTLELAEKLVAADPQDRNARLILGLKAFKDGHLGKAAEHFKASSTGPIGELTGAMAQAWVDFASGNTAAALARLDSPKQAEWAQFYLLYHRALISDLAGRRQDARQAYERIFKQDPKTLRTALAYARSAAHSGDVKLARSVLAQHIEKNQGEVHPLVRSLLAELNGPSQKPALLVETAGQGLAEVFYGLGEALIGEGAVPAGMLYMQMALSVEPNHQFSLAALANAYENSHRYADALATYERIPKGSPLELKIEVLKAYNLNSLDRADEAEKVLTSLLDRMVIVSDAEVPAAAAPEEASEPAEKAPVSGERDGSSAESPLRLGIKGDRVRELQEALNKLGFDAETPDGRFGVSTQRAVMDFQKAKGLKADGMAGPETLKAILGSAATASAAPAAPATPATVAPTAPLPAANPAAADAVSATTADKLQVLDALGSIQRAHKLYEDATKTYTSAIELIPKIDHRHWAFYYARGTSYERIKNWPAAEADLKKALDLAPEQPLVLNYLGYSWIDQGMNLKQGMALIEKAVALKPDDGFIVDSLGWAHFKLGNFKDAVRYLERAVELKPDDPILNDHLGDALWRVGREREARFQWDQAMSLNPEPEDAEKIKHKLAEGLAPRTEAEVPEHKTSEVKASTETPQQAQ